MTWELVIPQIIRGLINDLVPPYTYSDGRLEELIIISSHLLLNEITFDTTYTVSIQELTISPDPATDIGFINLVALKSSLIIIFNELKVSAAQSVSVIDGPAKIQLTDVYKSKKDLYDILQKQYENAKIQHQLGNQNPGKAIMSSYPMEDYPQHYFG